MKPPPIPTDEAQRVRRLHALGVLDTQAEAVLDSFTALAATSTGMPIALISLVDSDRQWFKSAVGLPAGMETPRAISFCGHAIHQDDLFEVEDAKADERFHDNPVVTGEPWVRHYAGAPLVMPEGERIGTLCVVENKPGRLTPHRRELLQGLARGVVNVLLLRESEQQQQASHRRKDEFLAMLAHELRNPLAPISTAAEIVRNFAEQPERVRRSAELIARQAGHMTALVDDLLDVSRVTRGLVHIEHAPVDLRQVVQLALEQTRGLLKARGHEWILRVPPEPVMVSGDKVRLTQIVSNLLSNAAKYTQPQGLVAILLEAQAPQATITVQDNGSGIAAELLPQVFDLFTQGSRGPDRSQGGLGLGLALARSIAKLHGGDVLAHSQGPGEGSRFTVALPLAADTPVAAQAPVPAPTAPAIPAPGPGLRVMVVDDNRDAAELLGVWLESHGHRPSVHVDSTRALDEALREPAEAYLLDIGLPDMDGYELARRLRASPRTRNSTLIALTGYGQSGDMARSRAAGFDFHFVKPMDPQRLAALMGQLAQKSTPAQ